MSTLSAAELREEQTWYRELGRRVEQRRITLKLTQQGLAAKAKLDRAHVSQLETGAKRASLRTLRRLAQALDTPVSELLRGL